MDSSTSARAMPHLQKVWRFLSQCGHASWLHFPKWTRSQYQINKGDHGCSVTHRRDAHVQAHVDASRLEISDSLRLQRGAELRRMQQAAGGGGNVVCGRG